MRVIDRGPGIPNLATILAGRYRSATGMGLGLIGARRLMDYFNVDTTPGQGTRVELKKTLPPRVGLVSERQLAEIAQALAALDANDPFDGCSGRIRSCCARSTSWRDGKRADGAEPRAGGHQSRRRRSMPSWKRRPITCAAPTISSRASCPT